MMRITLGGLAVFVSILASIQMAKIPELSGASSPDVAAASGFIARELDHDMATFYFGEVSTRYATGGTLYGVFDQLVADGYRPRVKKSLGFQFGYQYVSTSTEPVSVIFWQPSPNTKQLPGYVGHTRYADVVITKHPTEGIVTISTGGQHGANRLNLYPNGSIRARPGISFPDGRKTGVIIGGSWSPNANCPLGAIDVLANSTGHVRGSGDGFTVLVRVREPSGQGRTSSKQFCFSPITTGAVYSENGISLRVTLLPQATRG